MLAYFRLPMSWTTLVKRTLADTIEDDCLGLAAQLAFYFFLGVFPALIFLVSLLAYLPVEGALGLVLDRLQPVMPGDVTALLREQLAALLAGGRAGLMTFAAAGALWSGSSAITAIIYALNRAYDIEEWRPWWHTRLLAIALTIGIATFVLAALLLIVVGDELAGWIAGRIGAGPVFVQAWSVAQYLVAFGLAAFAVNLVYHFAPNADQDWVWLTPGAVLAVALWGATSLALRFYVQNLGSYTAIYGAIGSVIVLLLWFYLSGLALLVGAELNAEIDQAMPSRDDAPQGPGRRKKIGPAAEKAHASIGGTPAEGGARG